MTTTCGIDWDDAFDNSGHAPGSDALPGIWSDAAKRARDKLVAQGRARIGLAFGRHEREVVDVFAPEDASNGTMIFVHGGYWHKLDRTYWSHLARGCLAHGWSVAIPSYPLAPDARISQITQSICGAVEWAAADQKGPLRLVGHSAGGHLVTRMMCEGALPGAVAKRIARVVSISGVHHLNPLLATQMNETLRLTETEATDESPATHKPVAGIPVTFWTGSDERPEFYRQARMAAERWAAHGASVDTFFAPDRNHFTVIEPLNNPDSPLTREVLR